jgi:hypothetical protein
LLAYTDRYFPTQKRFGTSTGRRESARLDGREKLPRFQTERRFVLAGATDINFLPLHKKRENYHEGFGKQISNQHLFCRNVDHRLVPLVHGPGQHHLCCAIAGRVIRSFSCGWPKGGFGYIA